MACGAAGELTANGLRLRTHARPGPGRPRALLLHSLAAHGHWWDWAAPLLAERFDVLALDFRGHGGSDHASDGAYAFEDYAADGLAVLDALGGAPPLVLGHSMGGYVTAWLAAHHPGRMAGAVIVDILTAWPEAFAQLARRQAERVRHLGETGVIQRGAGHWVYAFDRRVFLHPPVDPWPFLSRIACPALVVHVEHSAVMDGATCERVAAEIPRGRAATLPGAHHHLLVEEPERLSRMVADWHRAIIAP